jgi:hypothetical protein
MKGATNRHIFNHYENKYYEVSWGRDAMVIATTTGVEDQSSNPAKTS